MGGIKNPDNKHYVLRRSNRESYVGQRWKYLCMQACFTTPSKSTRDVSKVTCQNCLRELRKMGEL